MRVPSHIGITGNEMADKTTHMATKTIFHPTLTDIPINVIKASIKQKINTVWKNYWDSIPLSNKFKKPPKSGIFLKI